MRRVFLFLMCVMLAACGGYKTPPRETWGGILAGASFGAMTETSKEAKKPVFLGNGGKIAPKNSEKYIADMEKKLYDTLRVPGVVVQRVGSDALVVMIRDTFMSQDTPEISSGGAKILDDIALILREFPATFIEVAGYTDAMRDQTQATALSFDMAERVSLFLVKHAVSPHRLFVIGRGSSRPLSDQTSTGRLMNRRVEMRISPVR